MERPSHVTSCLVVVYMYLQVCSFTRTDNEEIIFLERGHRGIVPCPPITSRKYTPGDIDAMYWYYGTTSSTALLISYFRGRVAPQNGIPHGIYDIDSEFSLVIENVTAKDEGIYHFMLKPRLQMVEEGQVEVCDKVSSRQRYPTVIECDPGSSDADHCEIRVDQATPEHNLTCVVDQVKPAVELFWIRPFLGGFTVLNASTSVKPVSLPANTGSSLRNHTYSTSASIQVNDVDDDAVYQCEAMGVAVGSGSSHMTVHFTKTVPTTASYETQPFSNPGDTISWPDRVDIHTSESTLKPPSLIVPLFGMCVTLLLLVVWIAFATTRIMCRRGSVYLNEEVFAMYFKSA
ncbi:uncharacterized protein LOC110989569 [Acanthaster planci]|uniref:Uncharacterized protein LOC110989569 n=1 Tax=Acanthaster planci TaxID=133434 RepID=A0A8B7ZWG0_ACAPL|nr:uncharacterized protein LOC110989569 [Acanthaster planci]XP_022109759.1 uncharacterized protein LOC110989569 [Acanthaster planci]XP_022109760.1 uncharacterized protein LOC110989569 [Acanthaster planci]XP_022109761.1 uncharacterized protein LOC110989569 [Acanthaster planci]XP_022109762.1 uncharacterized protein LOC110989569 [Acanthaster planci]